jgi:microcystin-dependent protein
MSEPFLAEIRIMSFGFAPKGWALCNGQFLPINQNQALFSLLGTMYGGNGITTFALPNLQGRVPIHLGGGFVQGEAGGEEVHTLTLSEMPQHSHAAFASALPAVQSGPANAFSTNTGRNAYAAAPNAAMAPEAVTPVGGSQPHDNLSPFLVLNFCIALQGIFPSRN